MKKTIYRALFGCILVIVIMTIGASSGSAPFLTYVYSNSMEPLIKVDDAFFIWPDLDYHIGDIIMFRPVTLKAQHITHRIVDVGDKGYITKGDNAPYRDQESGEPQVTKDRIIGKVFTIKDKPVVLPALGKLTTGAKAVFGSYSIYISLLFIAIGTILALTGRKSSAYRRRLRRRYRLKDVYRLITIIAVIAVVVSIYLGSSVKQVKYLVSKYPGDTENHIKANEVGNLRLIVNNNGLVPVCSIATGITPFNIKQLPVFIPPRSGKTVDIAVLPHQKTGIYHGYVQVYNYPVLLPSAIINKLHNINPWLAIVTEAVALGIYFMMFFRIVGHVHGFEGFIPLKVIKDKITGRRIKRTRAILLGRRKLM